MDITIILRVFAVHSFIQFKLFCKSITETKHSQCTSILNIVTLLNCDATILQTFKLLEKKDKQFYFVLKCALSNFKGKYAFDYVHSLNIYILSRFYKRKL